MTTITNPFMHFKLIKDYRQAAKVEHKLSDIILLTICGVLSGFDTWEGISDFGESRIDFLTSLGDFKNGIPSSDTIARVMGMVNPTAMQKAFISWMKDCHQLTEGEVVAIDGKTVRGSYNKSEERSAIHMVNAFATAQGLCLGQSKVNDKTNEITEIPRLLELLNLSGCLVTIDAMGCQRKIAQKIVDKNADYLLAVKGNQGQLEQAINNFYRPSMLQNFVEGESYSSQEKGHGREETRCALVTNELSFLDDLAHEWPHLKSVGIMVNFRQFEEPATEEDMSIRFYISSKRLSAKELHDATRSHWGIESMHWQLDITFREDECRIRVDDRAEVFSRIRQVCLNLLKQETSFKGGIQRKRMKCAMDVSYLSKVLRVLE
ncbi:ISAs1 family transposase [Vibrio parahaemolyticus]|uniref:ISAs1 family transposase n=1 Tax=Vibrio parahaemolyticus TaxID=670 RepID=UPI0003E21C17|nr:ISAs1 family transposase [Vibrio parahaemolyticus]EGR0202218.1 ISAs1 family transposase [Vibrio parahaemolyticus]EGR2290440.1 ISAs1 family transposase [Vibrio parahaemolyticus]EGR9082048.1 ISAs1 family transposase [Vibrio parahaemolyticus]EII5647827.1 ISAs1 family transposase [Vibrio parahaemolyticus]EIV8662343.1 ISAs1 family transposase [Vibrio parahaemolyticus]